MIPMQHPVIVIPGTYFTDLCALVTFMYSGEVNIYEHQLAGLLSVAETLQIRGLAEFTWSGNLANIDMGKKESLSQRCKRVKTTTPAPVTMTAAVEEITCSPPVPRPKHKTSAEQRPDENWMETDQNIAEDLSNRTVAGNAAPEVIEVNNQPDANMNCTNSPSLSLDLPNPSDLTQGTVETKSRNSACNPKMYATCFVCGKQLSNQYNLRVHMETHQNAHYACSACNHVSRSRDALRKHVSYRHPPTTAPATPRQP